MEGKYTEPVQIKPEEMTVASRAQEKALGLIKERFEDSPESDRLAYHNRVHTLDVIRRAGTIANALGLPKRERALVHLAAAFHDVVQNSKRVTREDGAIVRKQHTGENEIKSAQEAVAWMKEQTDVVFSDQECELVRTAILATTPTWNSEYGTVVQNTLTSQNNHVVRAVALADIGSVGMEPQNFGREGDALFIEQEIDITQALENAGGVDDISLENQEKYLARYRSWLHSQSSFATGRQTLFENELGDITDEAKNNLRQLFAHFDEGITIAQENAEAADAYNFTQMVHRLIPKVLQTESKHT